MRFLLAFVLAIFLLEVQGHTTITGVVIGGQTLTNCIRPRYPGNLYYQTGMGEQWPISSSNFLSSGVTSSNYTCGFIPYANQPAQSKCTIAAGSTIGITYYHGANSNEDPNLDRYIASSHKGPFMAFLAKSDTGVGPVWFKIYQSGKTQESTNFNNVKWASPDTLLQNSGTMYFTIPNDISPGNYLLRTEIIALHDTSLRGAQPYVHCTELTITGSGTANPPGVSIPGAWGYNDAGFTYNIYNQYTTPYPFPGPAVYVPGSLPSSTTNRATTGARATTGRSSTTGVRATTGRPGTGTGNVRINVVVTVGLPLAANLVDINIFIYEVTQVLSIPTTAISDITVDLDRSTASETIVVFTLWNAPGLDGNPIDPVAKARQLKNLADSQGLGSTSQLDGMRFISADSDLTSESGSAGGFVGSLGFIITVAVVGGVVLITIIIAVAVVIVKKRSSPAFY